MKLMNCLVIAGAPESKKVSIVKLDIKSDLVTLYAKKSNTDKPIFIKGLLSDPNLTLSKINTPRAKEIVAFLNQNEMQADLTSYANGSLRKFVQNLNPQIRDQFQAISGKKIETINSIYASESETVIQMVTDTFIKGGEELSRGNKAEHKNVCDTVKKHERTIERLQREIEDLKSIPNRTKEEQVKLERKENRLTNMKEKYQAYRAQAKNQGLDTSELDNLFIKINIFRPEELFRSSKNPFININNIGESEDVKSTFGKLVDSLSKESYRDTLLKIKQRINDSSVDQVLKEKKEFLEELQKMVDKKTVANKEEAKKLEARIEKNNADISRLREKHTEIKRELQALSKRENIDPKVVAQIESIVKGLNKLDALAAKNIINKETFKADLERNNPNVKNYMDLSMAFIDAEEESKNLLDIFMSGQIQTDDSKKILTQSLVGGLQNILSGKNNNVPRTKNNILEAISNRTGVMTTAIERKLDKEQLHFFEDIEMVTEKIKGLLAKLNTLSNSSVLGNSDMAEGELKKIMGAIKDASKLIKSKELTGGNNAVDNILDQLGKLENKLA